MTILVLIGTVFLLFDHLREVPLEDIIKLGNSSAAREFCEWVQVEIDVFIPHGKYQVNPRSSPWFWAACVGAIFRGIAFFYQKDKSSDSKVKFRQASNSCKRVLEAAKLAYAIKTKESFTSKKIDSRDF